jgi:Family of unknown function (DUF6498)
LKAILKRSLSLTDIFFILVNLVPLWGVWFHNWNPKEVFLVYCLESVIIGLYNVLMLWLTTLVKKKDLWENGNASTMVSGYFFIFFFIAHYGFFLFLQVGMFLSIAHIGNLEFTDFFTFIFHVRNYLSPSTEKLLILFIVIYGIFVLKDFVMPGLYKTASLGTLMFAPYARVFVQQFCVIIGGFLLTFNLGKIFILVFVLVKIFFEIVINYQKMIEDSVNKLPEKQPI